MTPTELTELVTSAKQRDFVIEDADGRVWIPTWANNDPQDRDWWHCYETSESCRTADLHRPLDVLVRVPLDEWEGPTEESTRRANDQQQPKGEPDEQCDD